MGNVLTEGIMLGMIKGNGISIRPQPPSPLVKLSNDKGIAK